MKVAMVCGKNKKVIADGMNRRFKSGVIRFDYLEWLDELPIYLRGNVDVERIIVVNEGFSQVKDIEETVFREKLVSLSESLDTSKCSIVFIVNLDELGCMIEEEMFNHIDRIRIVKHNTQYTVKLFERFILSDIKQIENSYSRPIDEYIDNSSVVVELEEDYTYDDVEVDVDVEYDYEYEEEVEQEIEQEPLEIEDNTELVETNIDDSQEKIEDTLIDFDVLGDNEPRELENNDVVDFEESVYEPEQLEEEIQNELEDFTDNVYTEDFEEDVYEDFEEDVYIVQEPVQEPIQEPVKQSKSSKKENKPKKQGWFNRLFSKDKEKASTEKKVKEPHKENKETKDIEQEELNVPIIDNDMDNDDFDTDIYNTDDADDLEAYASLNPKQVKEVMELLNKIALRRCSMAFSGTRNSGTTTVAYNIACMLNYFGFSVLYVDTDIQYRPASYINSSVFRTVHTNDYTSIGYLKAISSPVNYADNVVILNSGLHLITLGLDQDYKSLRANVNREKISRFYSIVKDNYDFVIYDTDLEFINSHGVDVLYNVDYLVTTVESNTKGLIELLINYGNIEDEDNRKLIFMKSKVLLTKHRKDTLYFGKKFKNFEKLLSHLDRMGEEITGSKSELLFSNLRFVGVLPYDKKVDDKWFDNSIGLLSQTVSDNLLVLLKEIITR